MKSNPNLQNLIEELKQLGTEKKVNLWRRIAKDLEKPTRSRRIVNLSRISRYTKENDTIIVPGKVLGSGLLNHKLTIAAFAFSEGAIQKITSANGKAIHIQDLMKEDIRDKKIRLIG